MYAPQTLEATRSAISLPALESGVWPCVGRDGRTTDLFGLGHAPANLSARQAKALDLMTSGTSGRRGTGSSSSAALQSSLESRLRARLNGSALCEVTWKPWDIPSQPNLSRPRARVRSTYGTAFSLWPTPAARDWRSESASPEFYDKWLANPKGKTLPMLLALASYGSTDPMASGAPLNPGFVRWLMGLPPAWDEFAPMETPSTRGRAKRSSNVQLTPVMSSPNPELEHSP